VNTQWGAGVAEEQVPYFASSRASFLSAHSGGGAGDAALAAWIPAISGFSPHVGGGFSARLLEFADGAHGSGHPGHGLEVPGIEIGGAARALTHYTQFDVLSNEKHDAHHCAGLSGKTRVMHCRARTQDCLHANSVSCAQEPQTTTTTTSGLRRGGTGLKIRRKMGSERHCLGPGRR
jgi:hypothetical protein